MCPWIQYGRWWILIFKVRLFFCTLYSLLLFHSSTLLCDFFIGRFGVCQKAFDFKKFGLANISIPSKENGCQCVRKILFLLFCSLYRVWLRSCLRFRDNCAGHTVLFARYRMLTHGIVYVWEARDYEGTRLYDWFYLSHFVHSSTIFPTFLYFSAFERANTSWFPFIINLCFLCSSFSTCLMGPFRKIPAPTGGIRLMDF